MTYMGGVGVGELQRCRGKQQGDPRRQEGIGPERGLAAKGQIGLRVCSWTFIGL